MKTLRTFLCLCLSGVAVFTHAQESILPGTQPLALRGATAQRLHVSASLPAGVRSGFQGRIVDVSLQIATQRVR